MEFAKSAHESAPIQIAFTPRQREVITAMAIENVTLCQAYEVEPHVGDAYFLEHDATTIPFPPDAIVGEGGLIWRLVGYGNRTEDIEDMARWYVAPEVEDPLIYRRAMGARALQLAGQLVQEYSIAYVPVQGEQVERKARDILKNSEDVDKWRRSLTDN